MEVKLQIIQPATLELVQPATLELVQSPALQIVQPVKHPECNGNRQRFCKYDCIYCYNRSFASSNRAVNWSNKNNITPREISLNSNKKYWFNCDRCPHDFETSLGKINIGRWCPYCSNKKLCNNNNCGICFNKSFASSKRAINWSVKNNLAPRDAHLNSDKKYRFNCDKCTHEFEARLHDITGKDSWCPYCSNKKLCSDNECNHCSNNSFATHEKAKYWSVKNGNITPRQVFKSSYNKYWFNCDNCPHEFKSVLYSINGGNWCPICKNKTETKLHEALSQNYQVIYQPKYDWCINIETNRRLPFDFEISDYNIIIELDGDQHFKQVSNWISPEETRQRDIFKMDRANENGYTVIRIYQMDVFKDKNNWWVKLTDAIKNYEIPTRLFISSGDHYDNHI